MTIKVAIVAVDYCLASAVSGAADLLHAANLAWHHLHPHKPTLFNWKIISENGKPVVASNGSYQLVDCKWDQPNDIDLLFVVGISVVDEAKFLVLLERNQALYQWLREQAAKNVIFASSCTGSFLLAEAGLLVGKNATTAWQYSRLFSRRYPNIKVESDALLVDNGSILCAGSAMSYQDLMLAIIKRFAGPTTSSLVSRHMLIENNRDSQAAFRITDSQDYNDDLIVEVTEYIRGNLHTKIPIDEIAERFHISCRTLIRRFHKATGDTPGTFIQNQRVESARRLLEISVMPLDEIVNHIGYTDISAFRRLFKRSTGLTPSEYRHRFGI